VRHNPCHDRIGRRIDVISSSIKTCQMVEIKNTKY
jgi:hypothetical protein